MAFVGAVGRLLADLGPGLERVTAVGVAGVAESGAALDGQGRAVAPVIAWHDPRGQETVDLLEGRFGEALHHRIGQPLRTVSSVAKVGWLLNQGVTSLDRWLGVPELCLFHLTGAMLTEYSLAARTGCYHVAERRWMPDVTEAVGFPVEVFPPVEPAGAVMGRVSAEGSAWSALPQGVPVTVAGHDHLAGAEGVSAAEADLVNSVGTAETVMRRTPTPPDTDRSLDLGTAVTLRPGGAEWVVLASAARAGLVLDRAAAALDLGLEELDRLAGGVDPVEVDDDLVRAIQDGDDPELPSGSPGEVWNGLLHALSRRTVESAGRLVDLLGPAERIVVFGGGSRSVPWMRAKAQVADVPVVRTRAPEAVARGAATLAGVAAGWWTDAGAAPVPPLEEVEARERS